MVKKRNERLAQTVIKGLQSRNMSGYYSADKEEALKKALELIPEGSSIAMGGCRSAHEIGLIKALEAGNYNYIDRDKMDARAGLLAAYDADIFLSSANAITSDGVMVNIDGNSNRVSCIAEILQAYRQNPCNSGERGSGILKAAPFTMVMSFILGRIILQAECICPGNPPFFICTFDTYITF